LVEKSGWPLVPFFEVEKIKKTLFGGQIWLENKFEKSGNLL
jgi:hypothetical protein